MGARGRRCRRFVHVSLGAALLFLPQSAHAQKVRNALNRPVVLTLSTRTLRLQPDASAELTPAELSSPTVSRLVQQGELMVLPTQATKRRR